MKWLIQGFLVLVAGLTSIGISIAQDSNPFIWDPFNLSLQIPEGWQTIDEGLQLILLPEGVESLDENEPSIVITIIEPDSDAEKTLVHHTPTLRPTVESIQFGDAVWPTVTDIPPMSGRQAYLILVHDTFLISATAPVEMWDAFDPVLTQMIDTIDAKPTRIPLDLRLTQPITWRGLSLKTPSNYITGNGSVDNFFILTTQRNRLMTASFFRPDTLFMEILDLSAIRASLGPQSLNAVNTLWYHAEDFTRDTTATRTEGDITFYSAMVNGEDVVAGQIVLILTPRNAYFIAGIAGAEKWEADERELFEAILATLEVQ